MQTLARPLGLAIKLALTVTLVGLSAAAINSQNPTPQEPQEPRAIALEAWHGYLEQIGWPREMRERIAPRFLGTLSKTVGNDHGGKTITFDGSRPGLRATVTLVLGRDGKPVVAPEVYLADVTER